MYYEFIKKIYQSYELNDTPLLRSWGGIKTHKSPASRSYFRRRLRDISQSFHIIYNHATTSTICTRRDATRRDAKGRFDEGRPGG